MEATQFPKLNRVSKDELPPKDLSLISKWMEECKGIGTGMIGHHLKPQLTHSQFQNYNYDGVVDQLFTNEDRSIFFLQAEGRLRIWSPSEAVLLPSAHTVTQNEADEVVTQVSFEDSKLQQLFDEIEKKIIEGLAGAKTSNLFIGSLARIWVPAVSFNRKIEYYNPCQKWTSSIQTFESLSQQHAFDNPEVYWSTLNEGDIEVVIGNNKLKFDPNYVKKTFLISSCLRKKSDDQLICWAMTHWDMAISSIHTLKDYRRKGLARAVLFDLMKKQVEFITSRGLQRQTIWLHADIEADNEASCAFFKSCGFEKEIDNIWMKASEQ